MTFSKHATVHHLDSNCFNDIGDKSMTLVVFRNTNGFDHLAKNNQYFDKFATKTKNQTVVVFYGSLYLTEENTITVASWYNTATVSIVFTLIILGLLLYFTMHFMLMVQSAGSAQFAKVKQD